MPTVLRKPLLTLIILGSIVGDSFAQLSANFTYQTACDRTVTFTNHSSGFTTTNWAFGDAGTSAAVSPSHQYASSGSFTVTLTVSNGLLSSTSTQSVVIYDPPSQSINGVISICKNDQATYSISTNGNNYQWTVYGGSIISGQGTSSINVVWANSGSGYVELTETNPLGCTSTTRMSVNILPLPTPAFFIPSDSLTGQDRLSVCIYDTKTYSLVPPLNAGSTYLWEITGGEIVGSDNLDEVVVHWTIEGDGKIKITETTAQGCTGSTEVPLTVSPSPVASFTTDDICFGNEATFTDQSTGDVATWFWDFGDGTNSQYQLPTHLYTAPGNYDVTLVVSASPLFPTFPPYSSEVCSDDTTISITVDQNPGPPIICPGTVCAGDEDTYTTPAVAGASYTWAVTGGTITSGGGTSDNEITIVWGNGPVGTISLLVTGAGISCPFPTIVEIPIVSPSPPISGPTVVCRFNTFLYEAPILPGATYNWTVTGSANPIYNYGQGTNRISLYFPNNGTATITLNVDHDVANCSGQTSLTVNVLSPFSLSASAYACTQSTVNYSVFGTPNPTGYTWNWSVNGGTITSGQGTSTVSVQWGSGTAGEITVDAPAGIYCNSQEKRAITIKPLPPPATLSGALNVCETSTVTYFVPGGFYNTWTVTGGTITSGGTGNNVASISWGTGSSGQITVVQEDRTTWPYCPTTTNFSVNISDNNPITISGPTTVCYNSTATYTSSSNASYPHLWEVTGGTILSGLGTNSITVQWGNDLFGTVSVTEQICNNTELLTVEIITPEPPVIDTANATCDGSSITLFIAGEYTSYLWNTGATDSFISITSVGTYSVTVTDDFGCSAFGSVTMNTIPTLPVPTASIIGSAPSITPMVVLKLTALPDDHVYQWSTGWDMQDLFVTTAGIYSVTITNEYGCTAEADVVVTVTPDGGISGGGGNCPGGVGGGACPSVFPDFTYSQCNPVQFTNITNPPAIAYFWDFGDGTYAWDENPVQNYPGAGSYRVTLWASENGVCWNSVQHILDLQSYIKARFNISPACYSDPIQFTDVSSSALPITGWQWDFGDATTSTLQNPTHLYATPGTYLVTLTVTDGICSKSYQKSVIVRQLIAQFTYQEACLGFSTLFINNSTGSRPITRWNWTFGDATTSNRKNPAHKYAATGNYNVTLTVTDIAGCTASTSASINVIQFDAGNITYTGPTTFCEGDSSVLHAPTGAGYTYRWSTGATTDTLTVKHTGAYYVIVTETSGCKDTVGPVSVLVYPKPFAYIVPNGPLTFCAYSSYTTLIGNPTGAGFSHQWIKDGASAGTSQYYYVNNTNDSGSYEAVVTDNHGCKDTSSATVVTIYPNPPYPNITASGPTEFCEGGSVTLTAPAGYDYQWTNGSLSQSVTAVTTGGYGVTITDQSGCSNSNSEYVTVRPLPDMRLVPYGCYDLCLSDSTRIYGPQGMMSYAWSTGATTPSIVIRAAGTYNLTAINSFQCENSSSNLYISTSNFLGIDLGNDTSFCEGGTVTFDAGAGFSSYEWQDMSTGTTYTADTTGDYYVKVTDANGCEGGDTVSLIVFPNPVVNLVDTLICNATSYLLDAGPGTGYTYSWNDGSSSQTRSVSTDGTYSVTVTDVYTCSGSDAAIVSFSPVSLGVNLGSDQSFCDGGSITFDAGTAPVTYLWQDGVTTTSTFTATTSGVYSVTISDGIACFASDTVALDVLPNPVIDLRDSIVCDIVNLVLDAGSGYTYSWSNSSTNQTLPVSAPGTYSVTITAANTCTATDNATVSLATSTSPLTASAADTSICAGESVQLSVTGGTSYAWQPSATLSDASISNPVATPVVRTEYIVTAQDPVSGCAKSDTVTINVLPVLSGTVTPDTFLCEGGSVQLNASGGTGYNWSPVAGLSCPDCPDPVASPAQTTDYSVTISANGYCNDDILQVTVTVHPLPDPGLDSIVTISYGSEVIFTPNGGMDDYDWTATDGWSCDGCPNPTVAPLVTTVYTLQVTDSVGCKAMALGTVEVLSECEGRFFIPTAFSPNGDEHNDEFKIIHPGDLNLIDFKVFNRWGEIVFQTSDSNQGWDGFYKGDIQDIAVYAYYVQMTCGGDVKILVGNVTLVH